MNRLLQPLYLLWYLPVLAALTIICGTVSLLLSLVSTRLARYISNTAWGRAVLTPAGIRLRVLGRENLPTSGGGFILYANHSSLLDIPTVALATGLPVSWVAKASLGRIPFFGWALARVHMLVDRGGGSEAARQMVEEAGARLSRGEILSIVPEGTRNRGEAPLLPFKKGALILARRNGALLVPVAIKNAGALWPAGRLYPRPGVIRVRIGLPLPPLPGEKLALLGDRAQTVLQDLLTDDSW
jgi:1-acyl-sn-glycerol-3-phosphate acyltransferase